MSAPRFRVVWTHAVRVQWLGHLLIELSARREPSQPVFDAMERIAVRLAHNPDAEGESRPDDTRVYHDYPLTVTYEVHPEELVVVVVRAHYVRRPG